jgi:NO-binding membrane sensor protein with MHYT domain
MAAFQLPLAARYDWPTVLLSMAAAILASAVALFVVSRKMLTTAGTISGSVLTGGGIATMHYHWRENPVTQPSAFNAARAGPW